MYTWLQRMEISCGVKVTFSPVIPLSFLLSAAPSFGVFLSRTEWTRTKEGPWQQRWQRAISKERLLIHCLGPEHLQNASRKEVISAGVYSTWLKTALIVAWGRVQFGKCDSTSCSICFGLLFWNVINMEQMKKNVAFVQKIVSLKGLI